MEQKFIRLGSIIFRIDEIKAISFQLGVQENPCEDEDVFLTWVTRPSIKINKNILVEYLDELEMLKDYEKVSGILCGETHENESYGFYCSNKVINISK